MKILTENEKKMVKIWWSKFQEACEKYAESINGSYIEEKAIEEMDTANNKLISWGGLGIESRINRIGIENI